MDDLSYIGLLDRLNGLLVDSHTFESTLAILTQFNLSLTSFQFDYIIENQRGLNLIGIPLYSYKALWPGVDPPHYQTLQGDKVNVINNKLSSYPLPDINWKWGWDNWYIFMINDMDDQGWFYSYGFFRDKNDWNGKVNALKFVRKRIWIRLRQKVDVEVEEGEGEEDKKVLVLAH